MNQSERKHTFTLFFLLLLFSYVSTNTELNDGEFTSTISENLYFDSKLQDFTEYSLGIKWTSGHPNNAYTSPCISDINRDGELEIVIGGLCLDNNGETLWYTATSATGNTIIADINADSLPEVFQCTTGGIYCRDANGSLLWGFEETSEYEFSRPNLALGDLNSDGKLEIITGTTNGLILCIDCNGTLIWEFDDTIVNISDRLNNPVVVDIDFDGILDILFTHRALVCLNSDGELKWRGDAWTSSANLIGVGNFDSNISTSEIVVATTNTLICFNSIGTELWTTNTFENMITGFIVADLNGDSISEVIVGTNRIVHCVNNYGDTIWGFNAQRFIYNQPVVIDINGDDNLEILFGSGSYTLSCLDQDGSFLWNFAISDSISDAITFADIDDDGKVEIFLDTESMLYCLEISDSITSGNHQNLCAGGDPSRTNSIDSDGDYIVDCMEDYFNCDQEQEDTDGDGLKDGFEIYLYNTDPSTNDTDNDSLPDMWEVYNKLDATRNNTFEDPDGDGLTNIEEFNFSTNPLSDDTDNDNLNDYDEVFIYPTNPIDNDTDNDNLTDGDEILIYNTDPLKADSDDDGMPDGWEVDYGFDPLFNDSTEDNDSDGLSNLLEFEYLSNPFNNDTDNDILLDGEEVFVYFTSPILNDTDFDELLDWDEIFVHFTMPNKNDTEDDGMPDGWEVQYNLNPLEDDSLEDPDSDDLLNIDEFGNNTNPNNPDTDNDLMPDGWEVQYYLNPLVNDAPSDPDRDELQNVVEYNIGTNPRKRDTDDDGMPDGWEYNNNLDPTTSDGSEDSDEDELSNLLEYLHNTDPNLNDTDSDSLLDGLEVIVHKTNPLDSDTDDDGMLDGWEVQYELNPLFDDSSEDPDGDFIKNIDEYTQGKNPQQWDNWLILYGLFLIPAYLLIIFLGYYVPLKSRHYVLRKKYGFLSYKDMQLASESGFSNGDEFYTAILAGFSTKEQWLSANKQGFIFEDEWIEAQQSGFISLDSKKSTEKIGFDDFIEFRKEKTETMEKYRFILHNLFQNLLELKESNNLTVKRKKQLIKDLKKDISEIEPVRAKLIRYSDTPTDDHEYDKSVKSEIQRFKELVLEINKLLKP